MLAGVAKALVHRYEAQHVLIRAVVEVALTPYPVTERAVFNRGRKLCVS